MQRKICPCGSGNIFSTCCEKYILGYETAPTALALMQSRYSAYVVQNADYLINTTHLSTRALFSKEDILRWAQENQWKKLEIIAFDTTTVEFKAYFIGSNQEEHVHHERSSFEKVEGHWYYVDGVFFE